MSTLQGDLAGNGRRIAVVVSRFNHPVSSRLLDGCSARLKEAGCADPDVIWVPGAFEIPLAAQTAAESGRYDAIITLGAVIRGGTPHFDYVCRGVTDGVREVMMRTRVPLAFGVLTTDTAEQALERAARPGEPGPNKGAEAAEVALEMVSLVELLGRPEAR
jgi:6,7-dimethyl-8-ribityllumazine synthase